MRKVFAIFLVALAVIAVVTSCDDATPHVHQFSTDWAHDDTYHWHSATCGDTEEVDSKGKHVWEYKASDNGAKHIKTCKTCGYSVEETHKLEFRTTDDKAKHYQVCTECGKKTDAVDHTFTAAVTEDKTKHRETCTVCGYKKAPVAHTVENWTTDKEATEDEEGERHGNCTVCGYKVVEKIDMLEHTHEKSDKYTWDENRHWYPCTKAGCSYKFDEVAHSEWTYVKDDAAGHYQKCGVCGYAKESEKAEHTLKYYQTVTGEKHYQMCEVCGFKTTETEHAYTIEKYDDKSHWKNCVCGASSTASTHTMTAEIKDGKLIEVCSECSYSKDAENATVEAATEDDLKKYAEVDGVGTIKFTADITLTKAITVKNSITIDMQGKNLTISDGSISAGDDIVITVLNIGTDIQEVKIAGHDIIIADMNSSGNFTYCATMKAAVENAVDDNVIMLTTPQTLTETEEVNVDKSIVIWLNGQLLDGEKYLIIGDNGSIGLVGDRADGQGVNFGNALVATSYGDVSIYCATLNKAVEMAQSPGIVTLLDNITLDSTVKIDKSLTLDLNEKKITSNGIKAVSATGSEVELTIDGNGEIEATGARAVEAVNDAKVIIKNGTYSGTFAVGAGNFENTKADALDGHVVIENGTFNSTEFAVGVWGSSTLVIKDGTFTATDNAVIGTNGDKLLKNDKYSITISGGTFNGSITTGGFIACGVYMANTGEVNISGGTFNITGGIGVLVRCGKLTATGGTINLIAKDGLTEGKIGDSRIKIKTDSQIVVNDSSGYPGEGPEIASNSANFTVNDPNGNRYTAE